MKKRLPFILFAFLLCGCANKTSTESHFILDEIKTVVNWKGYTKNGDFNEGTIGVQSEYLTLDKNNDLQGTFLFPLLSITNSNLSSNDQKQQLIKKLHSEDFFFLVFYPEIKFTITRMEPFEKTGEDTIKKSNYIVTGDLVILGKAMPVSIPVNVSLKDHTLAVNGGFRIDLTQWGMNYIKDTLTTGKYSVQPYVDIDIKIFADRL